MQTIRRIAVAAFAAMFAFGGFRALATDGTWVAQQGVGTGGTDQTEWADPGNWVGGSVASNGNANLTAAAAQYIHLPDTLTITNFGVAGNSVFIGEGTLTFAPRDWSHSPRACYLYCPFKTDMLDNYQNFCGLGESGGALNVCGTRLAGTGGSPLYSGVVNYRYDLFATAAGEERAISERAGLVNADVNLRFIAPHGSSTNLTSRWVQTAGFAFLKQADGETPHVLSAGTIVTGDGIPADTFLKRVFPDGSIELSAAPTTSAAANALTFAAFNAKTEVSLAAFFAAFSSTGTHNIYAQKYRAEDDFTLRMAANSLRVVGNKKDLNQFAIKTEAGYLPGRIVISSTLGTEAIPCRIHLENCHLEIAVDNECYDYTQASIDNAAHTARITVTNNVVRKFAKLTKLVGTLVKDGAGTLSMHMPSDTAANLTGAIVVEEGTFSPEFIDAGTNSLASLTVRSGARFVVPKGVVLCVGSLVVEEGAIFSGNGRIVCPEIPDSVVAGLVLEEVVSIDDRRTSSSFSVDVFSRDPEMSIVGDDGIFVFGTNALLRVTRSGVLDVLVVGGGGGGGNKGGGGGGGSGVVYTQQMAVARGIYSLTVGRGGRGSPDASTRSTNGGDSMAFGLFAYGGGAGGTYDVHHTGGVGASGGGGGIEYPYSSNAKNKGGDGIDGQGYAGGNGFNTNLTNNAYRYCSGGGGGGAGAPGMDAGTVLVDGRRYASGGNGGDGVLCEIYGSKYYGGGGGGGTTVQSLSGSHVGGLGGGGNGGVTSGTGIVKAGKNGEDGFGGGGGGGSVYLAGGEGGAGGNGGNGIVIIRYRVRRNGAMLIVY